MEADSGKDDPCFASSTLACRLSSTLVTAADAYQLCFVQSTTEAAAELVEMKRLVAGDLVLSDKETVSRVVANQHKASAVTSTLLSLHTADGEALAVTPDHVLLLDSTFAAARSATIGSVLSSGAAVTAVSHSRGGVVNPITASGTILASGPSGVPVVAATANEWLADVLLSSYPKRTFSFALAAAFPATTQAYYDAVLEPFFNVAVPHLEKTKALVSAPAVAALCMLGDVSLAGGLFAFAFGKLTLAAVAVAAVAAKMARKM